VVRLAGVEEGDGVVDVDHPRSVAVTPRAVRSTGTLAPVGEPGAAIVFPGQGVEPYDLARILTEHAGHELVDALREALARVGVGLDTAWDALDLADTRVAQPAVYVASVVQATAGAPPPYVAAAGHSLGELSACAFAGVFDPIDGLALVVERAAIGHAAQARRPGRMLVVMRLDEPAVEWVRRSVVARGVGVLEVAVVNGPGQFVLSGDLEATEVALDVIADAGGVGRPLTIGGGYHSPLLVDAVEPFAAAVRRVARRDPAVPLVSCTTRAVLRAVDEVPEALARSLVLPVRWVETVAALAALGARSVVDAGPSRTLCNLARFAPMVDHDALSPDPKARGTSVPG